MERNRPDILLSVEVYVRASSVAGRDGSTGGVLWVILIRTSFGVDRRASRRRRDASAAAYSTLATVRKAIDVYFAGYGRYRAISCRTAADRTAFVKQMTQFTDEPGNQRHVWDALHVWALLAGAFPENPFNGWTQSG